MEANKKATWSLVLGILGVVCCGLFTGIPAIIVGNQAKREIAVSAQSGEGAAKAGVILGWVSVALGILAAIVWTIIIATNNLDAVFDVDSRY